MKKTMTMAAASIALVASAQAVTLVGLGSDNQGEHAGVSFTSWANLNTAADGTGDAIVNGNGSGVNQYFMTVSATIDGVDTDFDVTVTGNAGLDLRVATTNSLLSRDGGGTFQDGQGVTITISNITNSDVVFNGFTFFDVGSSALNGTEGATINGTLYETGAAVNGHNAGGFFDLAGAPEATFVHASDGTTSLRNVGLQFTTAVAVPEPSSTALLGLGGLALILRRRK